VRRVRSNVSSGVSFPQKENAVEAVEAMVPNVVECYGPPPDWASGRAVEGEHGARVPPSARAPGPSPFERGARCLETAGERNLELLGTSDRARARGPEPPEDGRRVESAIASARGRGVGVIFNPLVECHIDCCGSNRGARMRRVWAGTRRSAKRKAAEEPIVSAIRLRYGIPGPAPQETRTRTGRRDDASGGHLV